jgi:hypothetical protein
MIYSAILRILLLYCLTTEFHCVIIVSYSDPGNVFQVFQSSNKKTVYVIIKYLQVSKHNTSLDSPTFILA